MSDRVVLITGCASGIGRALAKVCRQHNFKVIATDRDPSAIEDLRSLGISTYGLNVNDTRQIREVVDTIDEEEDGVDVLINNAGFALMGPIIEVAYEELSRQFRTNVLGPLYLCQCVAPKMRQKGDGMIVNIGSVSGIASTPFAGAYCASKAAIHALTDALRMELEVFGIKVVLVQPGGIRTQLGVRAERKLQDNLKSDSWYTEIEEAVRSRATASQVDAISADVFAQKLASKVLLSRSPPTIFRMGKNSIKLPLLKKYLPSRLLDYILRQKFQLEKLKKT